MPRSEMTLEEAKAQKILESKSGEGTETQPRVEAKQIKMVREQDRIRVILGNIRKFRYSDRSLGKSKGSFVRKETVTGAVENALIF